MHKTILLAMTLLAFSLSAFSGSPARKLIKRMKKLQRAGIMVGHQDDPVYGHDWKWELGRSDVKDVVGDYPALMGFELGHLEQGKEKSLDQVPFPRIREEVKRQHERGGIIEISWHPDNPVTGKSAWDPSGFPVREILAGGSQHAKFNTWLKRIAEFLSSLRDKDGKLIPVVFRPWHEMGGGWFWWGSKSCTPEEFKQLFVYTHDVFTRQYKLDNLVWGYSPNAGDEDFLKYYPGDEYVDLMGFDLYDFEADNAKYQGNLKRELTRLAKVGKEHKKLIALTETGAQQLPDENWFSQVFWPVAREYSFSYVLFWRNAWDQHKETYMSYPGAPSEADFKKFAAEKRTLFVNDIKNKK
ncbi:glycoside hydrolase family 26 protein [Prevotella sp. KH2C16]|uniref:glycoside hydrolase family 26 protein n=1 Tax=Prevotella sp. KH2C16 TaxID=1855325 RepID=UPI0008E120EF|nr:glycosyl hydrolase [Prevotella sp. KH2C16]SFG33582.1 mannan endo-1,4-beta-mannosidase [Prevotella sp. KH2C16]